MLKYSILQIVPADVRTTSCQHDMGGPDYEDNCMSNRACSRCCAVAMFHYEVRAMTEQRCLSLLDAAHYCGVPKGTLRLHGPKPIKIGRRNVWDIHMLDRWLDSLGAGISALMARSETDKMLAALDD